METIECKCANCGKLFKKSKPEYNRRIAKGSINFYCCRKCAGIKINADKKKPDVDKICPICGVKFQTSSREKGATFCSRSCASKGSVTLARTQAGRKAAELGRISNPPLEQIQRVLKSREQWKYEELKSILDKNNEAYEFEYRINQYIYDLVLTKKKIIIEFDGPDHKVESVKENDKNKEFFAINKGYRYIRIPVIPNSLIPATILEDLYLRCII